MTVYPGDVRASSSPHFPCLIFFCLLFLHNMKMVSLLMLLFFFLFCFLRFFLKFDLGERFPILLLFVFAFSLISCWICQTKRLPYSWFLAWRFHPLFFLIFLCNLLLTSYCFCHMEDAFIFARIMDEAFQKFPLVFFYLPLLLLC